MNRKRALKRLFALVGGGALVYSSVKVWNIFKTPDLNDLNAFQPLIDELAETIIPRTDTPGAKDAHTGLFVSKMVRDCTSRAAQNKFLNGLHEIEEYSRTHFGQAYSECFYEQKLSILSYFEVEGKSFKGIAGKIDNKLFGDSFFATLKRYTVLGFCTSRPGATIAFNYEAVPGKYQTTAVDASTKAWATQ